jgi:hypothetical protein
MGGSKPTSNSKQSRRHSTNFLQVPLKRRKEVQKTEIVREEKRYEKNQAQVSGCTVGASQTGWANLSSSRNGDKFLHSFKVKMVQEWSIQEWSSCFKHTVLQEV